MPDRDQCRSLPRGWRQAARALLALGRGESSGLDQEVLDRGFIRELASGIPTLSATIRLFERFNHQPPLGPDLALDQLARATRGVAFDRNDSLLQQEANGRLMQRQHDPEQLIVGLLQRQLRHNVIDSKRGVAQVLRQEGRAVNVQGLLDAAQPAIAAVARQIRERPNFRRLHSVIPAVRPIDLNANLLGGGL